ncbi:putative translational regulatory protein ArgL [Pectobacterium carotovorum]
MNNYTYKVNFNSMSRF